MVHLLTQFGAEQSDGIGALGINAQSFIIQLITFIIVLWVLRRFAFKPILKVMDERRKTIESGVKLGEEMQKRQVAVEAEAEKTLQQARKEADGIIAQSHDAARQVATEVETKARKKADGILAEAEDRITQETARARKQLEKEIVSLVSDATEAIIGEKVDDKKDAALIEKALKAEA